MYELCQDELFRYKRHLPVIGLEGQKKLKNASVLCVGAGGLGCPALQYLAAAGIGAIGIIDADKIELSNLQRQVLFQTADVGRFKVEVAKERILALNDTLNVTIYTELLSSLNANGLIEQYDVVIDATDNYEARYLLNEMCRKFNIPLVSASIYQFDAQLSVFNYKNGPCYQCLYATPPPAAMTPNCAIGGVLGVLPGVIGTMQATEAIKVILDLGTVLSGTLLSIDLLSMQFNQFEISKHNCSLHPEVTFSDSALAVNSCDEPLLINAQELSDLLSNDAQSIQLIDVRQPYERTICDIGGTLLPLDTFHNHLEQFKHDQLTVIYCKSGARSKQACHILQKAGFSNARSLQGGILEWIDTIDAQLMKY